MVILEKGEQAYVPEGALRSPVDYRACFKETAKGCRMTALMAGD